MKKMMGRKNEEHQTNFHQLDSELKVFLVSPSFENVEDTDNLHN